MFIGVSCALAAGLLWGLVFIMPLLLPDYPGVLLSLGRYIAFGVIALALALPDWRRIRALTRSDWRNALALALIGNLLYYATLASAIQLAGAPLPAMLIGTLPVSIAVASNWRAVDALRWRLLLPPLLLILAGLVSVNFDELRHLDDRRTVSSYVLGCSLGLVALAAWTWYPIVNARHLQARVDLRSSTWATAQGLATLPLALIGLALYAGYRQWVPDGVQLPFGPRPLWFVGAMLVLGLGASWLGTLLWNKASQSLPTALAGQLIVFETLAALLYAFILRGSVPGALTLMGVLLLCAGVFSSLRVFQRR